MSNPHPINFLNALGAPAFVTTDAASILETMKAYFEEETGRTLSPSQAEMYLLETAAYMMGISAAESQLGFESCFVAWAGASHLEARGAGRNVTRLQPTASTTTARFSAATPALVRTTIPIGTRIADASGVVQFQTTEPAHIEPGSRHADVKLEATQTGAFANGFSAGSLSTLLDPIAGIDAAINLTETGNGAELEDLERYRARVALAFEGIGNGITEERYVADVLGWSASCIDVKVTRPSPGHVNIYPLMQTGAPNGEELTSLLSIFDESVVHQGDYIQAFAPTAHAFSFRLELTLSNPDAAELARASVQGILQEWGQSLGGYVSPSELIAAAKAVAGVVDAKIPDLAFVLVDDTQWRAGEIAELVTEVIS